MPDPKMKPTEARCWTCWGWGTNIQLIPTKEEKARDSYLRRSNEPCVRCAGTGLRMVPEGEI
jgi:hypothetical protein